MENTYITTIYKYYTGIFGWIFGPIFSIFFHQKKSTATNNQLQVPPLPRLGPRPPGHHRLLQRQRREGTGGGVNSLHVTELFLAKVGWEGRWKPLPCGCFQKWGNTPKWMVKIMENPELKVDDWGGKPHYFWKHPCDRFNPQQMEKKKLEHEKKCHVWAILKRCICANTICLYKLHLNMHLL